MVKLLPKKAINWPLLKNKKTSKGEKERKEIYIRGHCCYYILQKARLNISQDLFRWIMQWEQSHSSPSILAWINYCNMVTLLPLLVSFCIATIIVKQQIILNTKQFPYRNQPWLPHWVYIIPMSALLISFNNVSHTQNGPWNNHQVNNHPSHGQVTHAFDSNIYVV